MVQTQELLHTTINDIITEMFKMYYISEMYKKKNEMYYQANIFSLMGAF